MTIRKTIIVQVPIEIVCGSEAAVHGLEQSALGRVQRFGKAGSRTNAGDYDYTIDFRKAEVVKPNA